MKTFYNKQYSLTFALAFALFALVIYGYLDANWTPAPANPPALNVPAPVNVGTEAQIKLGSLGAASFISPQYTMTFNNTSARATTTWLMRGNVTENANFGQYINTDGGNPARARTTGFAWRERYNPGNGNYVFETSSTSVAAGQPITWTTAMTIQGDGRVSIPRLSIPEILGNSVNLPAVGGWGGAGYRGFYSCPPNHVITGAHFWAGRSIDRIQFVCTAIGDTRLSGSSSWRRVSLNQSCECSRGWTQETFRCELDGVQVDDQNCNTPKPADVICTSLFNCPQSSIENLDR